MHISHYTQLEKTVNQSVKIFSNTLRRGFLIGFQWFTPTFRCVWCLVSQNNFTFPSILAGGQTGSDRAGLDWAMTNQIPHGGWCPKGRKAEDGRIPDVYQLQETTSADYPERTERNILDSDGTVIFTLLPSLGRGSRLTVKLANMHGKAWLHIHRETLQPACLLANFIQAHQIHRLNVAGSRASQAPGIGRFVLSVLTQTATILATLPK
jgi:hypothetical protein